MTIYDANRPYEMSFVVGNSGGVHGRVALEVSQVAQDFSGEVRYLFRGKIVDAKSVMQLLCCCTNYGSEVKFRFYPEKQVVSEDGEAFRDVRSKLEKALSSED